MNFDKRTKAECVIPVAPTPDERCADSEFSLANPGICPSALILKPSVANICRLESVEFKVYEYRNGTETPVTDGLEFSSSNLSAFVVGVNSGTGTALATGQAVITVTKDGKHATARVTVVGESNCCNGVEVSSAVVVDVSRSASLPFGDIYNTRLDFAKAAAIAYSIPIMSVGNQPKDSVKPWTIDIAATDLLGAFSQSESELQTAFESIVQGVQKTDLLPLFDSIAADLVVTAAAADRRVLVLISDGEHIVNTDKQAIIDAAVEFKAAGNVIVVVGVRASGNGFDLLERIATPGFFINAKAEDPTLALNGLNYLKSILCTGRCVPLGDAFTHDPSLDYSSYANWEVLQGQTHLLGPGLMDMLPGNGLYVDMAGGSPALIRTIDSFEVQAGRSYRFAITAAGNQREDIANQRLKIYVRQVGISDSDPNVIEQIIAPLWNQAFQKYTFTFNVTADMSVRLYLEQLESPAFGNLVDRVEFEDITTLTNLLDDNFDDENLVYITPRCGPSSPMPAIDDPPPPTAQLYFDSGAALGADEAYQYAVSYVTQHGETAATRLEISGANTNALFEDSVIKVTMPVPTEERVVRKRLWRSLGTTLGAYDPDATLYLIAELDPSQAVYLDSERTADFSARYEPSVTSPASNTTAVGLGAFGYGYEDCCDYSEGGPGVQELIPEMTDNTTPSGEASASENNIDAYTAFDSDEAVSTWLSSVWPSWLQYRFGDGQHRASYYEITAHVVPFQDGPGDWKLQGSNNGVDWTTLDERTGHGAWVDGVAERFDIAASGLYEYYRILVNAAAGSSTTTSISNLQLFLIGVISDECPTCDIVPPEAQSPDENALPDIESDYTPPTIFTSTKSMCASCPEGSQAFSNLVPAMTSETEPSGVVSASSFDQTGAGTDLGYEPFRAFDHKEQGQEVGVNSSWAAGGALPQWLQYQFASAQTVRTYSIRCAKAVSAPRDFKLQGSSDGSTWVDLDSRVDQVWFDGALRSYTIAAPLSYAYYRLYVTDSTNGACIVDELELFDTATAQVCGTATRTSSVSQSHADQLAEEAALADAQSRLNCLPVFTATVTHTAKCEDIGAYGPDVTKTVTKQSLISQADAEQQAAAAAQAEAEAELDCEQSNNEQQITINDNQGGTLAKASPYPSVQFVDLGFAAVIGAVTVTIRGFTHNSPDDVHILLRSPSGTFVTLMRNCGGVPPGSGVSGIDITFDDTAGSSLPDGVGMTGGTFKPTQNGPEVDFPSPVPAGPYNNTLAAFNGEDPAGSWSLWVCDDLTVWPGAITGGWEVIIAVV